MSKRPSLFLHLLQRKLAEGHSFVEASDWALAAVQEAYALIAESVLGPLALEQRTAPSSSTAGDKPPVDPDYQGRRRASAA